MRIVDAGLDEIAFVDQAQHGRDFGLVGQVVHAPCLQHEPGLGFVVFGLVEREAAADGAIVVVDALGAIQPGRRSEVDAPGFIVELRAGREHEVFASILAMHLCLTETRDEPEVRLGLARVPAVHQTGIGDIGQIERILLVVRTHIGVGDTESIPGRDGVVGVDLAPIGAEIAHRHPGVLESHRRRNRRRCQCSAGQQQRGRQAQQTESNHIVSSQGSTRAICPSGTASKRWAC